MSHDLKDLLKTECLVCGKKTGCFCKRCKLVSYCSAEHQKEDWPNHKRRCHPIRESEDAQLGRFLEAKHDIAGSQIIFIEEPLIIGPKWYQTEAERAGPIVPCVSCCHPCRVATTLCAKCRWPMCRGKCIHDPFECMLLSLGPGINPKSSIAVQHDYFREDALLVLKILCLQRTNPEKWETFMQMQSHEKERFNSALYHDADKRVVSFLMQKFLIHVRTAEKELVPRGSECLLKEYTSDVLHRICGIIETNYMIMELESGIEVSGIFRNGAMIEHNCVPNCYFQFEPKTSQLVVRAGGKIKKGEHLQVCYTDIMWSTPWRQCHLRATKYFQCNCMRCNDPTELGSNIGALRCQGVGEELCDGIQSPVEPCNENSVWKCNKCAATNSNLSVMHMISRIRGEVDMAIACRVDIKRLEALIRNLSELISPTHYLLNPLKHSLIQLYGSERGIALSCLTSKHLERKLELCDELYGICTIIDPYHIKIPIYLGIVIIEKALGNEELARRNPSQCDLYLGKARECLNEATDVLEKVRPSLNGKKILGRLDKEMADLEILVIQMHSK